MFLFLGRLYLLKTSAKPIGLLQSHHLDSCASSVTAAGVGIELWCIWNSLTKSVTNPDPMGLESQSNRIRCEVLNCPWMLPSGWIWVSSSLSVPLHGRSSFSLLSASSAFLYPVYLSASGSLCAWCADLLSPSCSCMRRLSSEHQATLPPGGKGGEVIFINWDMSPGGWNQTTYSGFQKDTWTWTLKNNHF